jgi:hypothetical protein
MYPAPKIAMSYSFDNDMKTLRFYTVMGLLSLLAISCDPDKEISDNVSGEMIAVHVNMLSIKEGQSEEMRRSAAPISSLTGRREIARTSQPLGNGFLLDMSLEPDTTSSLRAAIPLEENKKFRVIALNHANGRYVSHGDYVITSTGVSKTGGDLHVLKGASHDFICLSYNSTSKGFTETYKVNTAPANLPVPTDGTDLLYDSMLDRTFNSAAEATLGFSLTHKLSKVTLIVDCTYNEWDITDIVANKIRLMPTYANATMKLQDGSVDAGEAAGTQYFTWTTPLTPAQTQTSVTRTVFTSDASIRVVIPAEALTASGTAIPVGAAKTVAFPTATSLSPGYNYTLRVNIRIPLFAGSNIYWKWKDDSDPTHAEGGYLTFDLATDVDKHEGYQGVFFRFGSLVGISPKTSGAGNISTLAPIPIYVPVVASPLTSSSWTATTYGAAGYTKFTVAAGNDTDSDPEIPYLDGRTDFRATDNTRNSTYVIDAERNDPTEMYAKLRGDICQYLGKTGVVPDIYRLPTSTEFGIAHSNGNWEWNTSNPMGGGWIKSNPFNDNFSGNDEFGTYDMIENNRGYGENIIMDARFPITGGFFVEDTDLWYASGGANYWTGSTRNGLLGWALVFYNIHVIPNDQDYNRGYAIAIRCVRKVDPNGSY